MFIPSVKENAKVILYLFKLYQKSEKEVCFPKDYLHRSLIIFLLILLIPIPYYESPEGTWGFQKSHK